MSKSIDKVRTFADGMRVQLAVTGDPGDEKVEVDRRAVVRALTNLIDNAVRYSEADQQVTVSVEVRDGRVAISVKDDGVGIPRAELERVFERFYRVARARSRETGGTGLGLAIVRHVAENHGGRVLVESKPGDGSTFTIELPLPEDSAA